MDYIDSILFPTDVYVRRINAGQLAAHAASAAAAMAASAAPAPYSLSVLGRRAPTPETTLTIAA